MTLDGVWNYPTHYRFGAGRVAELPEQVRELGMKRPLVITDSGLEKLEIMKSITSSLATGGFEPKVFSDIRSNPTGDNVRAGITAFQNGDHDGVVLVGGGSALDAGKVIAILANQNLALWDIVDEGDNWRRVDPTKSAPVIAIPTTAGTGSEVGRASVITDEDAQSKKIIFHPDMMPNVVIADPELTLGLPPLLTAATGMDALSHNLEAFCAPGYHPMARGIAVEGMRLIKSWLPEAYRDGQNLEARSHMVVASTMGATAFQRGLGAMHALAHPLGAIYDAHHGMLNAVLMPYVLVANRRAIEDDISMAAHTLGIKKPGFTGFLDWVLSLRQSLKIPETLGQLRIDASNVQKVGRMAVVDPTAATNPIRFTADQYADILEASILGKL